MRARPSKWRSATCPRHPVTAGALNNLAQACRFQGKYLEAEKPYREAIAILEDALGAQHPDVARGLTNLAAFYHERGREAGAEDLYLRAAADPGEGVRQARRPRRWWRAANWPTCCAGSGALPRRKSSREPPWPPWKARFREAIRACRDGSELRAPAGGDERTPLAQKEADVGGSAAAEPESYRLQSSRSLDHYLHASWRSTALKRGVAAQRIVDRVHLDRRQRSSCWRQPFSSQSSARSCSPRPR